MDASKKYQIRSLLFVVSSGMLIAFLFAGLMLYKYSPSGQYLIENILLSPDTIKTLSISHKNQSFVFDRLEFEYDDLQNGKKEKIQLSDIQYQMFYELIKANKSLNVVSAEIVNEFNKGHTAKLKIMIRKEGAGKENNFQEIEFSGNYFRVELRSDSENYAYFYHPDIYQKMIRFAAPKANS